MAEQALEPSIADGEVSDKPRFDKRFLGSE
jgi:hypothetical protein